MSAGDLLHHCEPLTGTPSGHLCLDRQSVYNFTRLTSVAVCSSVFSQVISMDGYFPCGDYELTVTEWMKNNKSSFPPRVNAQSDKAEALFVRAM